MQHARKNHPFVRLKTHNILVRGEGEQRGAAEVLYFTRLRLGRDLLPPRGLAEDREHREQWQHRLTMVYYVPWQSYLMFAMVYRPIRPGVENVRVDNLTSPPP